MTDFDKRREMDEMIEELEVAASNMMDECGECFGAICHMWRSGQDGCSREFLDALEKEIREQYRWLKDNFTWVEHDEEKCDKCGRGRSKYRELVWNEELPYH